MNTIKNKVQLIGNLGKDPEIVNLESRKKIAKFSLATSDTYKNSEGEKITQTEWHNIIAWNKTADIVKEFIKKGSLCTVEGKLTHRSYEKDGATKYITEVLLLDKNESSLPLVNEKEEVLPF
ncbi:UNVERIFIED_CONTAM: hypothetical protein GTU68_019232 [Idotea baltica]|nr:hypothetical protein [Idotea baltica]